LSGATLFQTDLSDADLSGTNLSNADLGFANLSGADRVMLSGSDRYYVELTRQGESSCTTSDFATQSAAQDWIDQDRERDGALDRRGQVASRRWP
jgi:uncharacterized protein YjbI with pentapeptide repeats